MGDKCTARLSWNKRIKSAPSCSLSNWEYVKPHPVYHCDEAMFAELEDKSVGPDTNRLILGNNLSIMRALLDEGREGTIDLIYIDPPYLSESDYSSKLVIGENTIERIAFQDKWDRGMDSYLDMLYPRLQMMHRLLSSQGSIFVHLDWHVSHYVKLILDEIFGSENLVNEIVWCYSGGTGSKRHFHRKHDIIFWYSKTKDYIFHPQYRPYSKQTLQRGLTRVKGPQYRLREDGALMQDWWTDINKILSPTAYENLKYPTQKPIALLKRIIACASNPESIVADFFAGAGTTAEAAEQMGRRWILADSSAIAITTSSMRLLKNNSKPYLIQTGECWPGEGRLQLYPITVSSCGNNNLLRIEIKDYQPGKEDNLNIGGKCYIDYWELDLDYQGVFHSDYQMLPKRRFNDLDLSLAVLLPARDQYCIALRTHDIYGHTTTEIKSIILA
jgi:site-specific DNA-methyltransferase (adenine-specific)